MINKLFGPVTEGGAGISLLRITVSGLSDFMPSDPYTYVNDWDMSLASFSIARDLEYILPVLKDAKAKNPNLQFMATPWSAPGWMKYENTLIGSSLNEAYVLQYTPD